MVADQNSQDYLRSENRVRISSIELDLVGI